MKIGWLLLSVLFGIIGDDPYIVTHVNGKVTHYPSGKPVLQWEKLTKKDSVVFASPTDWVSLISPKWGRSVVRKQKPINAPKVPGFLLAISENWVPVLTTGVMAGRAGVINAIADIPPFLYAFGNKDTVRLLLADSLQIPLNATRFNQRDQKFFYIQCFYQGELVNKKLRYREDGGNTVTLVIDRSLYTVDGHHVPALAFTDMQLFYYDQTSEKSFPVANLAIAVPERKILSTEIAILWQNMNILYKDSADKNKLIRENIFQELLRNYGFMNPEQIKSYL